MRPSIAAPVRLIVACLAGWGLHAASAAQNPGPGPEKANKLSLFVTKPGAPPAPLTAPVRIGSSTVVVAPNDTVEVLWKRNGIHLDMEALGVIYSLNPGL